MNVPRVTGAFLDTLDHSVSYISGLDVWTDIKVHQLLYMLFVCQMIKLIQDRH